MAKNLTSLRSLTRWYALGDSASTVFDDTSTLIALNGRYQEAFLLATANDGDFQFNGDGSQSISITSGTRAYTLATDLFKPERVEIKYPSSAANYQEAHQINAGNIQFYGKDNYAAGYPEFDLQGTKIEIFVSAKTADIGAVTNGIKVYYQKELTELAVAGDAIIFPDVFARFICVNAAKDYCGVNGLNSRLQWLEGESQRMEAKLVEYISNRNRAKRSRISFRKENYGVDDSGGFAVSDKRAF